MGKAVGGAAGPAIVVIALMGLVLFPSALLGGRVLSPSSTVLFAPPFLPDRPTDLTRIPNLALNDNTVLFEAHLALAREAIRGGHLPLWDPYVGTGRPLGAQQGAPLFPVSWLAYLLPFWHALGWIALIKLLIAGLGMALFCRAVGLGRPASLIAAVVFPFSSEYISFLGHGQDINFAMAPWALLAGERLAATGGIRPAAGLGLALGLSLYSGHPETFFLAALLAYAYLIFRLVQVRSEISVSLLRARLLLGIGAGVLACAIGALALTAFLDVFDQGQHLTRATSQHANLRDLFVGFSLPEFWGRPDKTLLRPETFAVFSSSYTGRAYLGVVPMLLAALGFVRRPAARQWFFAAVGVLAVLALLGGPSNIILHHLPGLSRVGSFHYTWVLALAGTMLAAYGAQRVLAGDQVARRRALILGLVIVAGAVAVAFVERSDLLSQLARGIHDVPTLRVNETSPAAAAAGSLVRFLLLAGAALAIVWGRRLVKSARFAAVALVTLCAVDLVLIDRHWWPQVPQSQVAPPAPASLQVARRSGPRWRVMGVSNALTPNLSERYGVLDARVNDLPELTRYSRLFTSLGGSDFPGYGETLVPRITTARLKLLDLLSVRWVLDGGGRIPVPPTLRVVSSRPGDRLLENPHALPRAWIAYSNGSAGGLPQALSEVSAASPRSLLVAPVIEGAAATASLNRPTPVTFTSSSSTHIDLTFHAVRSGWLVLTDSFYPGWQADIDGRNTQIYPANGAFRAVRVPAGNHRVTFSYTPVREIVGGWLSVGALVVALLLLVTPPRWRRWPLTRVRLMVRKSSRTST
jgi:hypothetical protein